MSDKLLKIVLTVAVFTIFQGSINAEGRYVVIAEASIPALMESAQNISHFSDKVSPGSSLLLAGGMIALSFQLRDLNISSDLRVLLYADSTGENPTPLIAFIATPSTLKKIERVKFNKHKFPAKKIGDRLFIAENNNLLDAVNTLPVKLDTKNSAVMVKLYPERYFTQCGGTMEAFKAKIEKEFSKGRKEKKTKIKGEIKALEGLLIQCENLDLNLDATSDDMALTLSVLPNRATMLAEAIQKNQGTLSQKNIVDLTEKVAKSQNFIITDEIKSALSFLLKRIFENSDTNTIAEQLCKFKISSDNSKLNITISVTPKQAKKILTTAKVLK